MVSLQPHNALRDGFRPADRRGKELFPKKACRISPFAHIMSTVDEQQEDNVKASIHRVSQSGRAPVLLDVFCTALPPAMAKALSPDFRERQTRGGCERLLRRGMISPPLPLHNHRPGQQPMYFQPDARRWTIDFCPSFVFAAPTKDAQHNLHAREPLPQMNKHNETIKVVVIYILFGSAWVYFSDTALAWIFRDPDTMMKLAIFKGLFFIAATSGLLYFLIARLSAKIKQSVDALRESEARLHFLVQNASDSLVIVNADGSQRYVSPAAERITGFPVAELEGRPLDALIHPDDMPAVAAAWNEAAAHPEKPVTVQYRHIHRSREWVFSEAIAQSFLHEPAINGVIASVRDISERKKAEEENSKLQAQLTQSQKMESVGRLAGGVAHDFNNMLAVILGQTEMAMERLDPMHPLFANLQDIHQAAQRAADLTQQLLAFARKQAVTPVALNLNDTVETLLTMLRRLIGENVDLIWRPGKDLALVTMDPTQVSQILVNLCVNARHAISDTGQIVIETANIVLGGADCDAIPDIVPGEYVRLLISDSGCGMDAETLDQLFEPFFTTREIGQGTGLGLSTVYGIVKQNKGAVTVQSEPGRGATFYIYLPSRRNKSGCVIQADAAPLDESGHETILLVEDEPMILEMTTTMLELQGYRVLGAAAPGEAVRLAREHQGDIHLLITDVVMPEMNGLDLARNLLSIYPNIKRLFMSGYTANVIASHGVLDPGVHFIQKPFSSRDLAAKAREALDADVAQQPEAVVQPGHRP
jgi:PAS domain S-box-containing protein